jgi:hypothetical protein
MNKTLTGVSAVVASAMIGETVTTNVYFTIDSDVRHLIKGTYPTEQAAREGIERLCSRYGDSLSDYVVKKVATTVETLG